MMIRLNNFSNSTLKSMHPEILTKNQLDLLPLIKEYKKNFILVGGTAIALYLGHRRSIDFDLFSNKPLNPKLIYKKISGKRFLIHERYIQKEINHTIVIHGVQITFFHYPFALTAKSHYKDYLRIPSLLDLAAMKVHALGGRGKWKDYVDLYFLLKDHFTLDTIINRATELFGGEFNSRLLRQQLCFFDDINYSEKVEFLVKPLPEKTIKKFLTDVAIS